MKSNALFFLLIIALTSCEKNIQFDLNQTSPTLVVDAQIENGLPPLVILTNSIPYFSSIDSSLLKNLFVHNAVVTISDSVSTFTLNEIPISIGSNTFFVYTLPPDSLVGNFNTSYQLRIQSEGKDYTANTRIPVLRATPDSFYFEQAPVNPDSNARVMKIKLTDPVGTGNYIRYWSKRNADPFLPGRKSVFTDEIIDGTTYTIQLEPGIDRNNPPKLGENFFKKSDTVVIKLASIDKSTYTFWNTWEFAAQSVGNPFSQPVKVLGNVSNGALGAFCGYASWYSNPVILK